MIGFFLAIIFVLLGSLYFDSKKKHEYWKKRRIPYVKPLPFFGNSFKMVAMRLSHGDLLQQIYNNNRNKNFVGIFEGNTPVFVPIDNELVGKILVKDYSHFVDHGVQKSDVYFNLFNLKGSRWNALRYIITPVFLTGKLRAMFPEMIKLSSTILTNLGKKEAKNVDINGISQEFTLAVIANCIFGLDISIEPESEFMKTALDYSKVSLIKYFKLLVIYFFPSLAKILGLTIMSKHASSFFYGIIRETLKSRQQNKIVRNDFIQLLLDIKQKGPTELNQSRIQEEDADLLYYLTPPAEVAEITDEVLICQALNFIEAGFDGLHLTIMFTLFELSKNQDVQNKAREDVIKVIKKYNELTFDSLNETSFLNNCIKETLRKYPLSPILYRQCTQRYWLDDGATIEPGTKIFVPILGLHYDPSHFPDPQSFNPDRFLQDTKAFTNIPFGDGPRMCIAMKFSQLVIKVACASILLNFRLELNADTHLPLKMDNKSFIPRPAAPILFKVIKIK